MEESKQNNGMLLGSVSIIDGKPHVSLAKIGKNVDGYFNLEGKRDGKSYKIRIDPQTLQSEIEEDGQFVKMDSEQAKKMFVIEPVLSLDLAMEHVVEMKIDSQTGYKTLSSIGNLNIDDTSSVDKTQNGKQSKQNLLKEQKIKPVISGNYRL